MGDPTRNLIVRVVNPEGNPVTRGQVGVLDTERNELQLRTDGGSTTRLRLDQQGEAICLGLPARVVTAVVTIPGVDGVVERTIDLLEEPEGPLVIVSGTPLEPLPIRVALIGQAADGTFSTLDFEGKAGFHEGIRRTQPKIIQAFRDGNLWPVEVASTLRVTSANGFERSRGKIEMGKPKTLPGGFTSPTFGYQSQRFDGTGYSGQPAIAETGSIPLWGVAGRNVIEIEADGYRSERVEVTLAAATTAASGPGRELVVFLKRVK